MSSTLSALEAGVVATAAGLTTVGLIGSIFIRPIRRVWRKAGQVFEDFVGEPARDGIPARPGVMAQLQTIHNEAADVAVALKATEKAAAQTRDDVAKALVKSEERTAAVIVDMDLRLAEVQEKVKVVHDELTPNGGYSAKDQLNRLDWEFPPADQQHIPGPARKKKKGRR